MSQSRIIITQDVLLAVAKTELDMSLDIFFDLTVTHRKN